MTVVIADLDALPPTLDAQQVAGILGCSVWCLYETVKRGECPVAPLHLGRKLRWPTAAVLHAVGLPAVQPADGMPEQSAPLEAMR